MKDKSIKLSLSLYSFSCHSGIQLPIILSKSPIISSEKNSNTQTTWMRNHISTRRVHGESVSRAFPSEIPFGETNGRTERGNGRRKGRKGHPSHFCYCRTRINAPLLSLRYVAVPRYSFHCEFTVLWRIVTSGIRTMEEGRIWRQSIRRRWSKGPIFTSARRVTTAFAICARVCIRDVGNSLLWRVAPNFRAIWCRVPRRLEG